MNNELTTARKQINAIDSQLVKLLQQRFQAVTQVNEYKRTHDLPILDSHREQRVLDRIADEAGDAQLTPYLQAIFQSIMKQSREYQAAHRKED